MNKLSYFLFYIITLVVMAKAKEEAPPEGGKPPNPEEGGPKPEGEGDAAGGPQPKEDLKPEESKIVQGYLLNFIKLTGKDVILVDVDKKMVVDKPEGNVMVYILAPPGVTENYLKTISDPKILEIFSISPEGGEGGAPPPGEGGAPPGEGGAPPPEGGAPPPEGAKK